MVFSPGWGGGGLGLFHPLHLPLAKLDSSQTRVKLGYTAVAEFSKCNFFAARFLPSVGSDLILSLKDIFPQTLNQNEMGLYIVCVGVL